MKKRLIEKRGSLIIVSLDILAIFCSVIVAYMLRFDFIIPVEYIYSVFIAVTVSITIKIPIFYSFGLYKGMYRFTSLWDMINILKSTTISSLLLIAIIGFLTFFKGIPRSIFLLDFILSSLIICGIRVAVRKEAPTHHFCPNQTISKYELLQLFKKNFRTDLSVKPNSSQEYTVSRVLETKYSTIKEIFGHNFLMKQAIRELAIEMEDQ